MITVLTPTYNRGYILKNAYDSLCRQSVKNFEWIIIDDGSMDNTELTVDQWLKNDNGFNIVYRKQENGGKHRGVNAGVKIAKGDYVLILDSDDYLDDDAIQKVNGWIETISNDESFAGVSGLKGCISTKKPIGGIIGREYVDAKNNERKKYKLLGDKAEVYKTSVMKKYPFPEFKDEKFISENSVWDAIANDGYKIRWFNEIIYWCDYLTDGLTKNLNVEFLVNNFEGYSYSTKIYVKTHGFPTRQVRLANYKKIAGYRGLTLRQQSKKLEVSKIEIVFSSIMYKFWRLVKHK